MYEKRMNDQPGEQPDAVTGATSPADAAAALDPGQHGGAPAAPPPCPPPGTCDADAVTGATPGVASACRELGMSSVDSVVRERGIKPPGVA